MYMGKSLHSFGDRLRIWHETPRGFMEHAGAYDTNSIKVLLVLCNFLHISEFWPTKRQKAFHLDAIGVPGQY